MICFTGIIPDTELAKTSSRNINKGELAKALNIACPAASYKLSGKVFGPFRI
jgi:hypothetical protein